MLHKNVIENKGGFRTLDTAELEAVGGGQGVGNPTKDGQTIGTNGERLISWNLADHTSIADGGNLVDLSIPSAMGDGSEYRVSSSGLGSNDDADPDPAPVDLAGNTNGSSAPSLNQSGGITALPQINLGSGVTGSGAVTGSPTNPTGVGVSGTIRR